MKYLAFATVLRPWRIVLPSLLALAWPLGYAAAQSPSTDTETNLEMLVAHAMSVHPAIRAAEDRVDAAQAAISPAGALPDPMLGLGITNFPVSDPGFDGPMTMKMVGIGQMIPFPGKLDLRTRVAEKELAAAEARVHAARWEVEQEVRSAYYQLAFYDRALEVVNNNAELLANFIQVTQARYAVGTGAQSDVLKARVEASRLAEEAARLTEQRRAALAQLNAALDRPSDTPVESPQVPERIARAAVADSPEEIRFASASLGARALNSPLPSLVELQDRAVQENQTLEAYQAMIAAQAARLELAGKAYLPDFNVSLQYGQTSVGSDVVSAMVSVPIPLHKESKQDARVAETRALLSALEADLNARQNQVRAEVAQAYADLEKDRAQLGLFVKSIIPQGRAALESATASFQVGRVDFLTLLDNQTTLYNYETAYFRSLTSFAQGLAEVERVVGAEILR